MTEPGGECTECPIAPGRRAFLRDVSLTVAGIVATLGLSRRAAAQFPVTLTEGTAITPTTHSYPVPAADGAQIDHKLEVIIVRWQGSAYAFNLSCPHQNTALRWDEKAQRFQCPKHHSRYQPDGTFIDGRATRGMDRLSITRDGDNLVVNLDAMHKQDIDAPGWTAAVVHLT